MSREIPYDPIICCDHCETLGAYDFMGDCLCAKCAATLLNGVPDEEETSLSDDACPA